MLFKLTAGRLAPAHPPLAHSNFASRVDGKFAYARELQTSSEIKMKMKIKTVSMVEDRRWVAVSWSHYTSPDLCGIPSGDWGLGACAPAQ
jgi:hypothetical protein